MHWNCSNTSFAESDSLPEFTVLTFIVTLSVQTKEVCGAVEVKNYEYIVLKPQSRHHNSHDNISD